MLKHEEHGYGAVRRAPAAFRRLCVETVWTAREKAAPTQPPSGGCVLKHRYTFIHDGRIIQPPSGGCVLKLFGFNLYADILEPAAFRRLCVETHLKHQKHRHHGPAAFRRLCVETYQRGRLSHSSLPAAFRRLCVETTAPKPTKPMPDQPPSGGCVLKRHRQ